MINSEEFVSAIDKVVGKISVQDVLLNLKSPSLRTANREMKELSLWFNNLSDGEKLFVQKIVTEASQSAIFGFFCVLDGVRVIEDTPNKGTLELKYKYEDQEVILTNLDGDFLHDIYKGL